MSSFLTGEIHNTENIFLTENLTSNSVWKFLGIPFTIIQDVSTYHPSTGFTCIATWDDRREFLNQNFHSSEWIYSKNKGICKYRITKQKEVETASWHWL